MTPPPERDHITWALALVALTVPALVWAHWGLAIAGAAGWLFLFWRYRR